MKLENHEQVKQAITVSTLDVFGMEVTEIDRGLALQSEMELVAGLYVKKVRWGGVAYQAGVATGDIISEVDGNPVRTLNDLKICLSAHEVMNPVGFLFRRVGEWRFMAFPFEGSHLGESSRLDAFQMFGRFTS